MQEGRQEGMLTLLYIMVNFALSLHEQCRGSASSIFKALAVLAVPVLYKRARHWSRSLLVARVVWHSIAFGVCHQCICNSLCMATSGTICAAQKDIVLPAAIHSRW